MRGSKYRYFVILIAAIYIFTGCAAAPKKPDQLIAGNYDYVKRIHYMAGPKRNEKEPGSGPQHCNCR